MQVARVTDGDTLVLQDGRRVRLIGINAPELGRSGMPDQPLARAALERVQRLVAHAASSLTMYPGQQPRDRHGRWLAHLSAGDASIEQDLVARGLAYHVAIPPNLALVPCLREAELAARGAGLGLWRDDRAMPSDAVVAGGYQRVRGRVERVVFADTWWVEFTGGFRAVIYPEHQRHWHRRDLAAWRGELVEIRGWVYPGRNGRWRMRLPTPDAQLRALP